MLSIKILLKLIYHSLIDILKCTIYLRKKYNFVILYPRIISFFLKNVLIYDKKNKSFFFQYTRNYYDLLTVYEIFGDQHYDINNFFDNKLKKDYIDKFPLKLIIDCGSNIGSSVEFFSRIYENTRIIGLEPEFNNYSFSKKNISCKNYLILNKAISSEDKSLKIDTNKIDERSYSITENNGKEIEGITIKNILKNYSKKHKPFLIKIDIEGHESELFKNNFEWINDFEIIIIEIHDWMLPGKSNSYNFINAVNSMPNKRDLIISGENLVSIKINEK